MFQSFQNCEYKMVIIFFTYAKTFNIGKIISIKIGNYIL